MRDERFASGGTVENCDPDAPKVISSKNIASFDTHFYCYNKVNGRTEGIVFTVERENENAPFILAYGKYRLETDAAFLQKIQEVIDKHSLVKINGQYSYTYGIVPECLNYIITAVYDSGERLHFDVKGMPSNPWCSDMRKALCDELVRHGIKDLLPPAEDRRLARFTLEFNEWPRHFDYTTIRTAGDEEGKRPVHFLKRIWNNETQSSECSDIIEIPEGFYAHITELVEQTGLRDYSNGEIDFPRQPFPGMVIGMGIGMGFNQPEEEIDKKRTPFIHYCCEGESGKQCNTFVYGDKIPEGLKEASAVIIKYIDEVFADDSLVHSTL